MNLVHNRKKKEDRETKILCEPVPFAISSSYIPFLFFRFLMCLSFVFLSRRLLACQPTFKVFLFTEYRRRLFGVAKLKTQRTIYRFQ